MIITAKYPGTCPACGERFAAGSNVNWAKGRKATHAVCPSDREPTDYDAEENARNDAADAAAGAYVADGLGETQDFISNVEAREERLHAQVSLADLPF